MVKEWPALPPAERIPDLSSAPMMRIPSIPLLFLLTIAVSACAPGAPLAASPLRTEPTAPLTSLPATFTPAALAPIGHLTPLPATLAALPSSTPPGVSTTSISLSPAARVPQCQPGQLEAYLQAASPSMNALVKAAQEARKLDALPRDRIQTLTETAQKDRARLAGIDPPACLEPAHEDMLDAARELETALQALLIGDPSRGREALRSSFELIAESVALTAYQVMEATATSTPGP